MADQATYLIPSATVCVEQEIKRSRFIATLGRACSKTQAQDFIQNIRETHPTARHHCWAYLAGKPTDGAVSGFSDDGEPHGTAGKPIFNVLVHSGLGEIVAVVTRYFGGIKLGTGGLVRAYSSSVQMAIDTLPVVAYVPTVLHRIAFPYAHESAVRRILNRMEIAILDVAYENQVIMQIKVPSTQKQTLMEHLQNETHGNVEAT